MDVQIRERPRIGFSSLCEYLSATPVRQFSILREQKYPKPFRTASYTNAIAQIQAHVVDGGALQPDGRGLKPHEREVVVQLLQDGWRCPAPHASRPQKDREPMVLRGVEISVYPDLILGDATGKSRRTGALKLYLAKGRDLDEQVGAWMASFLYQYQVTVAGDKSASPDLCMVYDVRQTKCYEAGKSHKRLFQNVETACQMIAAVWGALGE